jgi:hypothetical protein
MLAITGGTDDAASTVTNSSSLVFGIMGVGTFLMFFFFVVVILIWIFSTPCGTTSKVLSRIISVVIFVAVFLVLIFADHQSQFASSSYQEEVRYWRRGSAPLLNVMIRWLPHRAARLSVIIELFSCVPFYLRHWYSLSQIYDQSVIPRIILVIIMAIFSVVALLYLIAHTGESKKVTNFNLTSILSSHFSSISNRPIITQEFFSNSTFFNNSYPR